MSRSRRKHPVLKDGGNSHKGAKTDNNRYVRRVIINKSGRVKSCRPDRDSNCGAGTSTGGGGGGNA